MATKDLSSGDIKTQDELDDITTCCICTEVYTDPKALPCIHTFCMKCLRDTGLKSSKGPGDEMPCPICRRLFKIPTEGFPGLPKHFFIERLIQVSKVSGPSVVAKALCSVCLEESKGQLGKDTPTAYTYCFECKHNLCEECCIEHRKFKATKNHKLIPIDEHLAQSFCEVHEQKILDVYCADCKTVVCAICFIEEHNSHHGSHVNKCVDDFRKQIKSKTETMNECIAQAQMKKAELVMVKEQMQKRLGSLESDIDNRKRQIMQFADEHKSHLLQGLCSERLSILKEIQMLSDDIDGYLSNLDSFNSYCQRIMDKGSASDICSALSDLSVRAFELQQQCQPIIEQEIQEFKFCFIQSEIEVFLGEDLDNLIGEIEKEDDLKPKRRSKQIIRAEQSKEINILRQDNEELRKERTNYNAHVKKLQQELENNKTAIETLHVSNDKLKQELDAEKKTKHSLQSSNDKEKANYKEHIEKLKLELENSKTIINVLRGSNDQLKQELDAGKKTVKTLETKVEEPRKEQDDFQYRLDPVLVQTIRTKAAEEGKKSIRGLTILDKELFVVSEKSSEVEAYDSMEFSFSRRWKLKELIDPYDLASCSRNKCLYIFDYKGIGQPSEILKVDPNGNLIKNWSTGDGYARLSVTVESNVILTVYQKNKLNEYLPDGQLIREINLSSNAGIWRPWHAIKLTNGHFVVSHGRHDSDGLNRVCLVDADGKLKKSFGGTRGSTIGQMNGPLYLSVDENGFVMVIDRYNSRVLLLDSDLEFKREILSKEKHGLRYLRRVLLDESNGRLFVADNESDNQRIYIYNFK